MREIQSTTARAQVLREFLNDFEEKMQLEGDSAGDTQLSYPTALGAE